MNDGGGSNAGHVRVHRWDGSDWVQRGADIDGEAAGDESGFAVALSEDGSTVAIGANNNDDAGDNAGHVRVLRWDGSDWVQRGGDIDGEAASDQSGYSVALSEDGSTVAIGAILNDGGGNNAGHVRVYRWDGSGWVQRGDDIDGEDTDDLQPGSVTEWSGWSTALSADGLTVAVGSRYNSGSGLFAGHVRVWVFPAVAGTVAAAPPSVSCVPSVPVVGGVVTCTVTGGNANIDILWRAAYNPTFAEAGVTLDDAGSGEFSFVVPAAALGQELTVELVEWIAPVSLGVVGGPVPSSVPSGEGPVPVWTLVLAALVGVGLLRGGVRAHA